MDWFRSVSHMVSEVDMSVFFSDNQSGSSGLGCMALWRIMVVGIVRLGMTLASEKRVFLFKDSSYHGVCGIELGWSVEYSGKEFGLFLLEGNEASSRLLDILGGCMDFVKMGFDKTLLQSSFGCVVGNMWYTGDAWDTR